MGYPTIRAERKNRDYRYFLWGKYPQRSEEKALGWFKTYQEADQMALLLRNKQPLAEFRVEVHPFGIPYSLMEQARYDAGPNS